MNEWMNNIFYILLYRMKKYINIKHAKFKYK